ncbi:hypothetical protein ACFL0V_07245, partial [Nanoarchaeota archaeon]
MNEKELKKIHTNQRLLVLELQRRGVDVELLSEELELCEANYKGHKEFLLDRDSSITPYASSVLSGDKFVTKKLLQRAGISVVEGEQFYPDEIDQALDYAERFDHPLVKPVFGSHGDNVHMDLDSRVDVQQAIERTVS